MEVIPAVDLRGDKCVRLYQGDYSQETVYSDEPTKVALNWQAQGAPRLHLIDLDGAARGEPCNMSAIEEIVSAVQLPVQLGGGIRRLETVERLLNMGIERVILGTIAVEEPALVEEMCRRWGEAIIVSIDAQDGWVATRGWRERSSLSTVKLIEEMTILGVRRFIYTDISRDGTLTEPNFDAIAELVSESSFPIIASGGVASISHLQRLSQLGAEGAIVGRALYTGDVDLKEALLSFKE